LCQSAFLSKAYGGGSFEFPRGFSGLDFLHSPTRFSSKRHLQAILAILRLGKKSAQFLRHPFRLAASIGIA
jgi:hypothetical protein